MGNNGLKAELASVLTCRKSGDGSNVGQWQSESSPPTAAVQVCRTGQDGPVLPPSRQLTNAMNDHKAVPPSVWGNSLPSVWEPALWDPAAQTFGIDYVPAHKAEDQLSELPILNLHKGGFLESSMTAADGAAYSPEPFVQWYRRPHFEVWLLRAGPQWNSLGILATPDEESKLRINEVRGTSLIGTWNAVQQEDVQVRAGDRILAVNEVDDAESMLNEIRDHREGSYLRLSIEPGDNCVDANLPTLFGFGCSKYDPEPNGCPMERCGTGFPFCGYDSRRR